MERQYIFVKAINSSFTGITAVRKIDNREVQIGLVTILPINRRIGHTAAAVAYAITKCGNFPAGIRIDYEFLGIRVNPYRIAILIKSSDSPVERFGRVTSVFIIFV
ncbi:hypothetical protein SDC9_135514 [bioreactor metagenome]|uniref:Uncharacterized protein n=1 Tax=bioreactor metagenome TaxID=1076179 RepID=A0A645DG02_9ZZZZ